MQKTEPMPDNATTIAPPEVNENEARIFDTEHLEWVVYPDYRFTHRMKKEDVIEVIEEVGDIPSGYELITIEEAEELEEKKRIAKLGISKLEFYNYILKPNGIDYAQLLNILNNEMELAAAWDLCTGVYRGDEFLNQYIKEFIPAITDEFLDEIYKKYGKEKV